MGTESILCILFSVILTYGGLYYLLKARERKPVEGIFVSLFTCVIIVMLINSLGVSVVGYVEEETCSITGFTNVSISNSTMVCQRKNSPVYGYNPYIVVLYVPLVVWISSAVYYALLYMGKATETVVYSEV